MKKYYLSLCLLLAIGTASAYANRGIGEATRTTDPGVVIDGVRWATRNVDAPGTFAQNPESAGVFYQWNCRRAWSATGEVSDWNTSTPQGIIWEKTNDPCPPGWRVPTFDELRRLAHSANVISRSVEINGINGKAFEDETSGNTLFLPAVGWRSNDGALGSAGVGGHYWSSTPAAGTSARNLSFYSASFTSLGVSISTRAFGFSVRCVAK